MKNTFSRFVLLLILSFTLGVFGFTTGNSHLEAHRKEVIHNRKVIKKMMRKQQIPGVAIAVSIEGETIWQEGFGYANLENTTPVLPDSSQFRVGSISKPFTATAMAKLYEMQKLNLDADIHDYVKSFPTKKYPITIRQIAGHLAGIRHYKGREFTSNKAYPSVTEGLEIFQKDPLLFKPLSKFHYSSYGWNLLSAAVEGIVNQPFLGFMQESVFQPLNMEMTCADIKDSTLVYRTGFYSKKGKNVVIAPEVDNSHKWAGGGYLSTATDVLRFGNAYLNGEILNLTTIREFWGGQCTSGGKETYYGMGWQIWIDGNGYTWYGHSGGAVGGTSQLLIQPDKEIVLVMLTNITSADLKSTLKQLAETFSAI